MGALKFNAPLRFLVIILISCVGLLALVSHKEPGRTMLSLQTALGSTQLDESFIIFFTPVEGEVLSESQKTEASALTEQYAALIQHSLDGVITHTYDSLLYGIAFRLDYTEKALNVLGSESIPENVEKQTDKKLLSFLSGQMEEALKEAGLVLVLERDQKIEIKSM